MKMIELTRRDLIDWPSAKVAQARTFAEPELMRAVIDEVGLICVFDETDIDIWPLPRLIIVRDGKLREFLAWAATYLPHKPVTAFSRVVEQGSVDRGISREPFSESRVRLAIAGAVIGEAIQDIAESSLSASRIMSEALRSYSFLFARALVRGIFVSFDSAFPQRSDTLASIFDDDTTNASSVHAAWRLMVAILGQSRSLFGHDSEPSYVLSQYLRHTELRPFVRALAEDRERPLTQNREGRVRYFEQVTADLKQSVRRDDTHDMLQAFLADRIAPGSFEHSALLRTTAPRSSAALCWYGFFAGLQPNSKLSTYADGVAWRIAAEIFTSETTFGQTRGDIAIDELEMLVRHTATRASITPRRPPLLCIEVYPALYTYRNWPEAVDRSGASSERLSELGAALAEVNAVYSSLVTEQRQGRKSARRKR